MPEEKAATVTEGMKELWKDISSLFGGKDDKIAIPDGLKNEFNKTAVKVTKNVGQQILDLTGGEPNIIAPKMIVESVEDLFNGINMMIDPTSPKTNLFDQYLDMKHIDCKLLRSWVQKSYVNPSTTEIVRGLYEIILEIVDRLDAIENTLKRSWKHPDLGEDVLITELRKIGLALGKMLRKFRIWEENFNG
jgi:hypothetical protein